MLLLFQTNAFAAPDLGFSVGGCVAPVEVFVVGGEGAVRIDIGWCGENDQVGLYIRRRQG